MYARYTRWIAIFALWAFVGFVLSTEVFFNMRVHDPDVSFFEVAIPQYVRALYWAALTPVILGINAALPLGRRDALRNFSLHALLSFLVMAVFFLGRMIFVLWWEGESLRGFWQAANASFFGRNLIDMAFYWAVLAYGHMQHLQQQVRNKELEAAQLESRLMETELRALKQQLHPHFLFNTLNTISFLVREGRHESAVSLLAQLSHLLRTSLDSSRVHEVTLRQEIEFLDPYLQIQQARFLDRLTVEKELSSDAMNARIPNLLLQPIVENAIVHGVAAKSEPGVVRLRGRVEDGALHLEVQDDGPGLPEVARRREGIGISNTRERLAKMYGNHARLSLRGEAGMGTTVQIVLPYRT